MKLKKNRKNKTKNTTSKDLNKSKIDPRTYLQRCGIGASYIINFEEIVIQEKIGAGSYGEVFKGKWLC
jgi:hypothetical protein